MGKGFVFDQRIQDLLKLNSVAHPVFDVVVSGGSFTSVSINQTFKPKGYSSKDTRIGLNVSYPTSMPGRGANDPEQDPNAWARSIYLNDIPIERVMIDLMYQSFILICDRSFKKWYW